jgi:glycosyltransferase involved in cell wall biosynthesis
VVHTLSRGLTRRQHEVRVVGCYPEAGRTGDRQSEEGIDVWRLPGGSRRGSWVQARWGLWRLVADWARHGEIDLVEVPDWEGWAAGWAALPVPVTVRVHGSVSYFAAESGRSPRPLEQWLERASAARADAWCAVSEYAARRSQALLSFRDLSPAILYNPVEVQSLPPGPRSRHRVVFSGTLAAKKGVVCLCEAWNLVAAQAPGAELHLYGRDDRGPDGGSMRNYLLGRLLPRSAASVHFHGPVPRTQVRAALGQARVAVFPSLAEAFALAPLEAMETGCPTIYTSAGSGPELIQHGVDGLLVDPAEVGEISAAILKVLSDDDLAAQLGAAGRRAASERFSTDALIPRNEAFYARAIQAFTEGRRRRGGGARSA